MDHTHTSFDLFASSLLGCSIDRGRLKLINILGSGAGGVVFLAEEQPQCSISPTFYAVKCLIKAPPHSPKYHCQRREIQHHRKMSHHPNIVTLHHVVEEAEYIFLVLDYCSGGDLFNFLADGNVLSGDAARIKTAFLQILDALDACHKEGIYHRDVKPENIFCSADGTQFFLGDFGLSTASTYSKNFAVGSYSYMSPECLRYDVAPEAYSTLHNDIWALGPILTIMISGRNPWRLAATPDESYMAYLQDPNFLRKMLPISKGANLILRHIFTRREGSRISLGYLKQLVNELDTFFMDADDIARANRHVREIATLYFGNSRQIPARHETSTSCNVAPTHDRCLFTTTKRMRPRDARSSSEALPDASSTSL